MKKLFASLFLIGIFSAYVWSRSSVQTNANVPTTSSASSAPPAAVQTSSAPPVPTPVSPSPPKPIPTPTPVPVSPPVPRGRYRDGTYTGISADAYYGSVQVQVAVSGGKIADVVFLSFPNDRSHSRDVSVSTMPILKQEAIAAQSAPVDIVSGATEISSAFNQSLQSALSQAQNG